MVTTFIRRHPARLVMIKTVVERRKLQGERKKKVGHCDVTPCDVTPRRRCIGFELSRETANRSPN